MNTLFNKKLFVGNLPKEITEKELTKIFSKAGKINKIQLIKKRYTNIAQGFAYVDMATVEGAKKAIKTLHDLPLQDKKLTVYEAKVERK